MKLSDITLKNIKAFIEGNSKMWYDKLVGLPTHLKEQIQYRASKCTDCIEIGHKEKGPGTCKECGCKIPGKWFVKKSCNKGKRFPDLMENKEWYEYKRKNNI